MRLDYRIKETKRRYKEPVIDYFVTCPKDNKEKSDKICTGCKWFGWFREEGKGIVCRWSKQNEIRQQAE